MDKSSSGPKIGAENDNGNEVAARSGQATDGALIEELREEIKVRDDFLAIASHELRNPLTPILLCLQLIRAAQRPRDDAKLTHELARLERQIKHFVARTNVLLEVAQIRSGKVHLG